MYLGEEHAHLLRRVADEEGRSQAEILRDAILLYARTAGQRRAFACAAVADGPGDSVADVPEEELLRGFAQ